MTSELGVPEAGWAACVSLATWQMRAIFHLERAAEYLVILLHVGLSLCYTVAAFLICLKCVCKCCMPDWACPFVFLNNFSS